MRWRLISLIPLAFAACHKDPAPKPVTPVVPAPSDDVSSDQPTSPEPIVLAHDPAASSAKPDDHAASAAAIYDATNYVAPAELAYSRTLDAIIYPACGGGEGPGEHCGLAAFDKAGKDKKLPDDLQVTWFRYDHKKDDKRAQVIAKLTASLDKLDTYRLSRAPWSGDVPLQIPDYITLWWKPKDKMLVGVHEGRSSKVPTTWGEQGGPVNVFYSKDAPVVVAQRRFNPASGGREGYVVFIQLVVIPRP